jgi:hypothetical protein
MTGKRQVTGSYKTVRRMTILGAVLAAFLLVDGFVLFLTGGLNGDATPVFLFLGGSFANANRSSGTNLLIMGVLLALVTFAGWWWLGRPLRARERGAVAAGDGATPESNDPGRPGPANQRQA